MNKIPVGKTIAYAYGFTFGNFLTVLGLSWVPLILMAIVAYFALPTYFSSVAEIVTTGDTGPFLAAAGLMFLFVATVFAGFIMIYVAIARQALGLRSGPAYFYFSLDAAFWRLLLSYLLTILIFFGGMILAGIVSGILAVFLGGVATVAFLIVVFGMIYVLLRLVFLQPPLAVAEGRKVLSRSWSLSKGNFWRIFGILLAIFVPLIMVQFIMQITLFSSLAIRPIAPDADPDEIAAYLSQFMTQLAGLLPVLLVVGTLFNAALISLLTSASAFAYRSLVPAAEGTAAEFA